MKQILFSLIVFQFLFLYPSLKNAHAEVDLELKTNNIPANAIPYKNSWYCKSGYKRSAGSCIEIPIIIPANAYKSGSTWFCKDGYKKFGDICTQENTLISREVEKISSIDKTNISNLSNENICSWFDLKNVPDQYIFEATKRNLSCNGKVLINPSNNIKIPANAYKSGNTWYCKSGYKKSGNICNKIASNNIKIPANAYKSKSGNTWFCKSGYIRSGNICNKIASNNIKIPANAYKSGNTWYCKSGYKKSGNICNKIASNTKKSDSQDNFGYIFGLFLLIIFILIIFSPKNSHKKCAWCNNSKIKFIKGLEQEWFWRYSNKDGSRDKRRKDNYEQAKFKSKFQCQKCNALTGFLHEESQRPGPNAKIIKRNLLQRGSGERKGKNYE